MLLGHWHERESRHHGLGARESQGEIVLSIALALIGLGCAPIYPSIISLTPERFGAAASQSMVSLQMACAYVGSTVMPPLVAFVVAMRGAAFVPVLLGGILAAMVLLSEAANAKLAGGQSDTSKIR